MTDLDALKREAEALIPRLMDAANTNYGFMSRAAKDAHHLIQRLLLTLEDSRRYRWLRDRNNSKAAELISMYLEPEELDRAIDSAMEKGKK